MKALFSLLALVAIVVAYVLSASLYLQAQYFAAHSLVIAAITSLVFWIKSNDLLKATQKA